MASAARSSPDRCSARHEHLVEPPSPRTWASDALIDVAAHHHHDPIPCQHPHGSIPVHHLGSVQKSDHQSAKAQIDRHLAALQSARTTRRLGTSYLGSRSSDPPPRYRPVSSCVPPLRAESIRMTGGILRRREKPPDDPSPLYRPDGGTSRAGYRRSGATKVLCDLPSD